MEGREKSRRKVIEHLFSMTGGLKGRISVPPPRDWTRHWKEGPLPQSAEDVGTHSSQHLMIHPWEKLNCKLSNFLPVGNWSGKKKKRSVNALIYAKAKPLSSQIFEGGIKRKLYFMREEKYLGSISQIFYYHWVSSAEFLKRVHSEIPTLHFLAKTPHTENIFLFLKTSLLHMANILLVSRSLWSS